MEGGWRIGERFGLGVCKIEVTVEFEIHAVAHAGHVAHQVPHQTLFCPTADGTREPMITEARIRAPLQLVVEEQALVSCWILGGIVSRAAAAFMVMGRDKSLGWHWLGIFEKRIAEMAFL